MIGNIFIKATVFLLILLWVYAAISKLVDFHHFIAEMRNQVLPWVVQSILIYLLIPTELTVAALLVFERTTQTGLYCSLTLLLLFSSYVGLTAFHVFSRVPCSCGGILEKLGWTPHFIFNLFFFAITLTTIIIIKRKEIKAIN